MSHNAFQYLNHLQNEIINTNLKALSFISHMLTIAFVKILAVFYL